MELKKPLPPNRSYEQVMNHYLVEKEIADRLRKATWKERKRIYRNMYDELFAKVPDHPRLTRRESKKLTAQANEQKNALVNRYISKSTVFAEFAPGDCKFAYQVAKRVKKAYGIDISDQRNPRDPTPTNFNLIIYDGYNLDQVPNNSIDVMFSDQLLEHFHPDDTHLHLSTVYRLLKKGGKYIFRTPHPFSGPHDVSQYFCDEAECFHLKEWTYTEFGRMLIDIGYSNFRTRWRKRNVDLELPYHYFNVCEQALDLLPRGPMKKAAKYLIPALYGIAIK